MAREKGGEARRLREAANEAQMFWIHALIRNKWRKGSPHTRGGSGECCNTQFFEHFFSKDFSSRG